ncbi:MAG TPA: hypothetical protein PLN96_07780 [Zoogloea sp.]|uniref:hypothetical protein n=1 Tax=Zoogloea sp. TaxID=49181 RepID=UPI002BBABB01|nr:hypothetical protein [Zoogloea sp.]HMV17981.1 hypothetical protein [Rhodocyclaceae bacterium]HMV62257.1 hypothetical protein [Rhodocyclaceae bacterium]HMW50803.1 hypothetical protein [Rhodocyclaceae bacterium]HMY48247.1 hypothetical protein [Rhodocyclaceae bacterium]HMZ74935.1 hypothetical protein [Rhodocyclaceae bacterium]
MSSSELPVRFSAAEMEQIEAALTTLERLFMRYYILDSKERYGMGELGSTGEALCRRMLKIFAHEPLIMPDDFDLLAFRRDLAALDQLRPILARLQTLTDKATDAEALLNDELSFSVFDGYALVKMIGRPEDFDALLAIMAGTATEDFSGPPL